MLYNFQFRAFALAKVINLPLSMHVLTSILFLQNAPFFLHPLQMVSSMEEARLRDHSISSAANKDTHLWGPTHCTATTKETGMVQSQAVS